MILILVKKMFNYNNSGSTANRTPTKQWSILMNKINECVIWSSILLFVIYAASTVYTDLIITSSTILKGFF